MDRIFLENPVVRATVLIKGSRVDRTAKKFLKIKGRHAQKSLCLLALKLLGRREIQPDSFL
jgi:hypothetical protein